MLPLFVRQYQILQHGLNSTSQTMSPLFTLSKQAQPLFPRFTPLPLTHYDPNTNSPLASSSAPKTPSSSRPPFALRNQHDILCAPVFHVFHLAIGRHGPYRASGPLFDHVVRKDAAEDGSDARGGDREGGKSGEDLRMLDGGGVNGSLCVINILHGASACPSPLWSTDSRSRYSGSGMTP